MDPFYGIKLYGSYALAGIMLLVGGWLETSGLDGKALFFIGTTLSVFLIFTDIGIKIHSASMKDLALKSKIRYG